MQLDTITLPDELEWVDESSWSEVVSNIGYSVAGSLLEQTSSKLSGRTITLQGKSDSGWISRSTLEALLTLRDSNVTMTLTLEDARTFSVRFRYFETPIEVVSVRGFNNYDSGAKYIVNAIRLMEVS